MNIKIIRVDFFNGLSRIASGNCVKIKSETKEKLDKAFLRKKIDFKEDKIGLIDIDIGEMRISSFDKLNVIKRNDDLFEPGYKVSDDLKIRIVLAVGETMEPYQMVIDKINLLVKAAIKNENDNTYCIKDSKLEIHYIAKLSVSKYDGDKENAE